MKLQLLILILITISVVSFTNLNDKSSTENFNSKDSWQSNIPLTPSPDWTAEVNQAVARFGCSVSSAGDVNGDGLDDLIISAAYYDNGETDEGRVCVYYGSVNGLPSIPSWTAESNQAGASCYSAAGAGDVNGDGYSDIIAGAQYYDNGQQDEGKVYVYYGSSSGLSNIPDWTAESNQAGATFGILVSTAGDVNGDGFSDVIIGAQLYDNGQIDEGRAYVYYGSVNGLSDTANWIAESNQNYSLFGIYVSTAGDVNGDGFSDVIVGAPYFSNGQSNEGKAFVYFGSALGLSDTANWTAESNQAGSLYGYSVSGAGDLNDDGFDDVIIGAYLFDNGQTDEGRAFVYYGSSGGLSSAPDWTAESNQANARYGVSVSGAGDVNGDGKSDVIVGAYRFDNGETDEGSSYVYLGSASGLSLVPNRTAESNQANARFGYSVANAGDVNSDGLSDVIIGAVNYDDGELDEGAAFIYFGSSDYKTLTSSVLIQGFYNDIENEMKQDTMKIYLRNIISPYLIIDSANAFLDQSGTGTFKFFNVENGTAYYLELNHRNSIEIWSSSGKSFLSGVMSYNFTSGVSQAFGNNQIQIDASPLKFAIYNGDVNKDETIDGEDVSQVENGASISLSGYVSSDVTGDDFVDGSDLSIVENNAALGISVITP